MNPAQAKDAMTDTKGPFPALSPSTAPHSESQPTRGKPSGPAAPDVTLPLRFMAVGLASLLATVVLLVIRPDVLTTYHYNQWTTAITHLFVLGFGLSVAMGAMYQLVPVALETRLHSERLARWHFPVHLVSVAGMVWMFWVWDMKQVGHFGSGLALGVGLFVWNVVQTLRRAPRWTVVSFGITSTVFWLAAVVIAGLAVAAAKSTYERVGQPGISPALGATLEGLQAVAMFVGRFEPLGVMHAHAHLGVLGVFLVLIIGVGYRLVPMFLISDIQSRARAWASIGLLNAGILLSFATIVLQHPLKPAAALVVIAGLGLYGIELTTIVRARRRRSVDGGLQVFLISQALLAPVALLGLWLAQPGLALDESVGRLENTYGFLGLFGVVALAILGMLHKILPFLIWFVAYSQEVGRSRTPTLQEMGSPRLQAACFVLWITGLGVGTAAILLAHTAASRFAALLLAAGLLALLVNAGRILSHLVRPRRQPLRLRSP
ncbi:MAG: hypothetical protein AB7O66_02230 [Limisphaerales bacterium]